MYSVVARHEFVNFDDLNLIVGNPNLMRDATPMAALATESGNAVLSDAIRGRLDAYRKGQTVVRPNPQG